MFGHDADMRLRDGSRVSVVGAFGLDSGTAAAFARA
jgi:hypothetical protein